MANRPASDYYPDIGVLGEEFVAQWLQSTSWIILHRRWRCRWGEIDLVAKLDPLFQVAGEQGSRGAEGQVKNSSSTPYSLLPTPLLAFVEVKTRSRGNWDADGLLSITPQKQAKLWRTARCFLTTFPNLADYPCRFDVALVHYQKLPKKQLSQPSKTPLSIEIATGLSSWPIQLGQALVVAGYQLVLQEYIPSAFD